MSGKKAIMPNDSIPSHRISLDHSAPTASSTEILEDIPPRERDKNGKVRLNSKKTKPAIDAASVRSIENGFRV